MKTKEQAVAKAVCNEILASIGKLMAKGVEEPFVNGEQEIWKSGKQAGLYAAKKAVKEALDRALVGSGGLDLSNLTHVEFATKNPQTSPLNKIAVDESDKTLYSESVGDFPPIRFLDELWGYHWVSKNDAMSHLILRRGDITVEVSFRTKTYIISTFLSGKDLLYTSGNIDTDLPGFKKTLKKAEAFYQKTNKQHGNF